MHGAWECWNVDLLQIETQIEAAKIRETIFQQEQEILEENIAQNHEIERFLKTKFTNKELYQWMAGRLSELYFQTYKLALGMAFSAQKAFQFEQATFISPGHWDSLKKGLLAGEGLLLDLERMEKTYLNENSRDRVSLLPVPYSLCTVGNIKNVLFVRFRFYCFKPLSGRVKL